MPLQMIEQQPSFDYDDDLVASHELAKEPEKHTQRARFHLFRKIYTISFE